MDSKYIHILKITLKTKIYFYIIHLKLIFNEGLKELNI